MKLIGVIIQARMSSTRLPGKVLMELPYGGGVTVLEQVIRRVKKSKLIQKIIVATTVNEVDDKIVAVAKKEKVDYFRGSEDDILSRYYLAAKKNKLETVVRVTSDCPCLDWEIIDAMIKKHASSGADYTSNTVSRTFPRGLDVEVMEFSALKKAHERAMKPYEKEHVTPYVYEHPEIFKIEKLTAPPEIKKYVGARITLDTSEDYTLLCEIFDELYPRQPYFKAHEIIGLFKKKPWILLINQHVGQKKLKRKWRGKSSLILPQYMVNKLVLGTAQLGLDYGVTNQVGKMPRKDAEKILIYASQKGIVTLDTACTYGESEQIVGDLKFQKKARFKIVSKFFAPRTEDVHQILSQTLSDLHEKKIYGYLIHDFDFFLKHPQILELLRSYQKKNVIEKIGFSLYYPREVDYLLKNNIKFDLVQIPLSILDQRFMPYLIPLKERQVTISVRSIFLQGVLLLPPGKLTAKFDRFAQKLTALNKLSRTAHLGANALCLGFALTNPFIDQVLIGVSSLKDLQENLQAAKSAEKIIPVYQKLLSFKEDDETVLLPMNWKKW